MRFQPSKVDELDELQLLSVEDGLMGCSKDADLFQDRLNACRDVVRSSAMLSELRDALVPYADSITKIRCLALGSFHDDIPARYQLALLLEIEQIIRTENKGSVSVSLYDPVFTKDDLDYLRKRGPEFTVDEVASKNFRDSDSNQVLYFLPHAPLDLTEKVLIDEEPRLWLANNIVEHTDRYTKAMLHDKYPVLGKMLHVLEPIDKTKEQIKAVDPDDEFKTFVSKKKKRRNKNVFKEPEIDYGSVASYFKKCSIVTDFKGGSLLKNQPWINAFSDLTFHLIE